MGLKIVIILAIMATLSYATLQQVSTVAIDPLEHQDFTPLDFVEIIVNAQPEVISKSVRHFLNEKIKLLTKTKSSSAIKQELANWFSQEQVQTISQQICEFIKERLFNRLGTTILYLEMISLSDSFKKEIENHPADYFLSYDMYDLLIDE